MLKRLHHDELIPLGIGYYSAPEAARLLRTPARKINRWLGGYSYRDPIGQMVEMAPLWTPQLPMLGDHIELWFRDLIELRFALIALAVGIDYFSFGDSGGVGWTAKNLCIGWG